MIFPPILLLAPTLALATVLPRDEWNNEVDEWARNRRPPPQLIDAFKAKPDGDKPTLEDYKVPNQYVKIILSLGDSYTAGTGLNGPKHLYLDSGTFKEGCSRYSKAWPEKLRDHPG
jgi:hypothetical protein